MARIQIGFTSLSLATTALAGADDVASVDFSRDIQPILSSHCFQCHGPDEDKLESELRMPPSDHGERLSEAQIALLRRWIEQEAPYAKHWSFQPIVRPALPALGAAAPEQWTHNPIDALNRDLPFDQFTIEQLAGDLLDNPTLEQRIATGFHRNTLINSSLMRAAIWRPSIPATCCSRGNRVCVSKQRSSATWRWPSAAS